MSGMDRDPLRVLADVVGIYSPTKREGRLAKFLVKEMRSLGYEDPHVDEAGNAVGHSGSGRLRVLLCGHMDTVPGKLPVRVTKRAIYGRGATDAKSPLCALLFAGAKAAESGASVTFAGVTDEEGAGRGVQGLISRRHKYDFAVFGEPAGSRRVTVGYRGRMSLQIKVESGGGHAGSPWAHSSAFDLFCYAVSKLRGYAESTQTGEDHFRSVSVTPTIVRSGDYQNVLPSFCDATLDVRVPPGLSCADVQKTLVEILSGLEPRDAFRYSFSEPTEPYEVDPNSLLVRAFQRAIILKTKAKPLMVRKTGTGDMNTFAAATRAQCVTFGPGETGLSHTDDEMVYLRDYLESIEVLKESISQLSLLSK